MRLQGAFYHKASKTLMVTDAVVYLPVKPPEVASVCLVAVWTCCGAEPASYKQPALQVINRAKLLHAGKDNTFVRLVRLRAELSCTVSCVGMHSQVWLVPMSFETYHCACGCLARTARCLQPCRVAPCARSICSATRSCRRGRCTAGVWQGACEHSGDGGRAGAHWCAAAAPRRSPG